MYGGPPPKPMFSTKKVFSKLFGSGRFHCDGGMMPLGHCPFLVAILLGGAGGVFFVTPFSMYSPEVLL